MTGAELWFAGMALLAYSGACLLALTLKERLKLVVLFISGLVIGVTIGCIIGLRINADLAYRQGVVDGAELARDK